MSLSLDAGQSATPGQPTKLYSAREIGEMVLQKVGAYSPMDGGADPDDLDITLNWMEVVVGHLSGTKRLQWLIPATVEFALDDDVASYLLSDVAGAAFPGLRILYPISAAVITSAGAETPVDLIRRWEYEAYPQKDTSGSPNAVYIDRTNDDPTIYTYPVKAADDTTLSLRLVVQTYAPSVLGQSASSANEQAGNVQHGFSSVWQLWLINATAAEVGNGPVRRLSLSDRKDIRDERDRQLVDLLAYMRENTSLRKRRTARYGG